MAISVIFWQNKKTKMDFLDFWDWELANFLRPGNGRKIDLSGAGPFFGVLTMLIC